VSDVRRSWRRTRNTWDANPPRPNVVILNPPTAWRPLRGRMQTLRVFPGYCCTAAVHGEEAFEKQSGRRDLNPRPLDPQILASSRAPSVRPGQQLFGSPQRSPVIRLNACPLLYLGAVPGEEFSGCSRCAAVLLSFSHDRLSPSSGRGRPGWSGCRRGRGRGSAR